MKKHMKVVRVPANHKNAVILADVHIPKQDAHCIVLAKRYAKEYGATCIILNGDIIDSAAFGRHGHKPSDEAVGKYFDQTRLFLETLRGEFPDALIYWNEGNHDLWFARYIQQNARVLQNDAYFTLQRRLDLDGLGIIYNPENTILRFGDTNIIHGHQLFRASYNGDNPAKAAFNALHESTIISHVHRISFYHKRLPSTGKLIMCHSTCCLSELAPAYNPTANYMNGFAHLRKTGSKAIVRNLIIDKEILF